jgi:RNA exonuclease 1
MKEVVLQISSGSIASLFLCKFSLVAEILLQVKNDNISFVWTQFSGLISYLLKRAQDPEKLKSCVAEAIALKTCDRKTARKRAKDQTCPELKEILSELDKKIRKLYDTLPENAMFIICTGHGDTPLVQR